MRQVPQKAIELIRKFEGCKLKAYKCAAGKWTIGYGHTGKDVYEFLDITQDQAEIMLLQDAQEACDAVLRLVKVPLTDNELSALISLCFNIGMTNFKKSTLLRILNLGWYEQVPAQIMRWNKVNGEVLGGLSRRRAAESALWSK